MTAREPAGSEWLGAMSDGSPEPAATTDSEPGPRYRLGGELGVGAMGRVRAAYDALLEREVAVKQVRAVGDAAAEAALLREARVTAGLDHPGIIAVLDAGTDADGQRFYAMRVVHGRSLAEVTAAGLDVAARTALVRAILQVAQAMAYAHARGVVHRDLSPNNVRLGAHGEVVVMDWGMAALVEEAARSRIVCGTPGYRAPELARGDAASPASDVWSVGALLHLVVVGVPPGESLPRRGLRAELRSLLARALAPSPSDRYADAGELARDLAAFLDGGQLRAHRDRPWDRAARLGRRHPGALAVGGLGITVAAVVAVVLGTRAAHSADQARRSRSQARVALREMVVERADDAVLADRRVDAEARAAQADELGAVAAATGVVAAFAAAPSVTVRPIGDEGGCRTLAVRADGERLCVADRRLWLRAGGASPASRSLDLDGRTPVAARVLADGGVLVVVAAPTDTGNQVVRFDRALAVVGQHVMTGGTPSIDEAAGWAIVGSPDLYLAVAPDGSARSVRPCSAGVAIRLIAASPASTPREPATVVWCADGTLVRSGPGEAIRVPTPELEARLPGAATGVVIGGRLVIGGSDARVGVVDLSTGKVMHVSASAVGAVRRVAAGPGGDAIVVGADGVGWWRPELGAWRHVVGARDAVDASVVDGRVVAYGAGTLAAWELGAGTGTHRLTARAGLAAVAWSPDGALVAFGGGAGGVAVLEPSTGRVRWVAVTNQVVKSLAFGQGGRTLTVGVATAAGLRVLDLDSLGERPGPWVDAALAVRRLGLLTPDVVLAFDYGTGRWCFDLRTGQRRAVATITEPVVDASTPTDAGAVFALGEQGALWRYDGDAQTRLRGAPGGVAVAVSGDGRVIALVGRDGNRIEFRDAATDDERGTLAAPGASIEDAALDPRGEQLALGRADGTVEIWGIADRRQRLVVRAHAGRAAAVAFSPDGCTLATAGWDAVGRLLALCGLPAAR